MKKGKKILLTLLIVTVFAGIVCLTYKVLGKIENTNKNEGYKLNGFIVKPIENKEENLNENILKEEMQDESSAIQEKETTDEKSKYTDVLEEYSTVEKQQETELEYEDNTIGTIEIPKLGVVAPIKEGTDLETLALYVGHFSNSDVWDGNVALAAHNRGVSVKHYFDRINELVNGDIIIYKTKLGEKSYYVSDIKEIKSTDWSVTERNTNGKDIITLITCINNQPDKRLCVVAEEKNS